jgi:hypothetical protein
VGSAATEGGRVVIVEAVDVLLTLGWALAACLLAVSVVGTVVVLGAAAAIRWTTERALRALTGRRSHEQPQSAPE